MLHCGCSDQGSNPGLTLYSSSHRSTEGCVATDYTMLVRIQLGRQFAGEGNFEIPALRLTTSRSASELLSIVCGANGTRTRNLLRDRQAKCAIFCSTVFYF